MPKQRLQVERGMRPAPLTPSAAPVDTFVRTNAGSSLDQLASALSAVTPSLARFTAVLQDERTRGNEEQRIAGQKAFREQVVEKKKTFDQAVKEGVIPRGANPFFVAGFKEQAGRVAADNWRSDLITAMAGDEALREATDLKAFDDFAVKHREAWMQANVGENRDKFFEVGFGNRADAWLSSTREEQARAVANNVEKMSDEAHFAEVKRHVMDGIQKGFSLEQLAGDINQLNDDVIGHGRDGAAVSRTTVRAIAAAALERATMGDLNARKYLSILKSIRGKTGALADTTYGTEATLKIGQEIDQQLWTANERDRQRTAQERDDRKRTVLSDAIRELAQNPNADLKKYVAKLGDQPDAAGDLAQLQNNMKVLTFRTDEVLKRDLFADVWEDPSFSAANVLSWLKQGRLETQDAAWLIGQIESRDAAYRTAQGADQKIFQDFQFEQTLKDIDSNFIDPITKIIPADKADASRYARAMLMQRWAEYRMGAGAQASIPERSKWLVDAADAVITYIRGSKKKDIKAPSPILSQTDWHKDPILKEPDIARIRQELKEGAPSEYTLSVLALNGVFTAEQISEFLSAQFALLKPKKATAAPTVRSPGVTATQPEMKGLPATVITAPQTSNP